jgi:subfamily B ATP-binding cassette protein MsbA
MRLMLRFLIESRGLWAIWLAPLVTMLLTIPVLFATPLLERQVIDGVLLSNRMDLLVPTVALVALLWFAGATLQLVGAVLRTYLGELLARRVQRELFAHCERLALAFSNRQHSGRTMALFSSDVPAVAGFVSTTSILAIGSVITILVGVVVVFSLNWQLALVAAVVPPLLTGAVAIVTRPLRRIARQVQDKNAELGEQLYEGLAGMREVVAFGQEHAQESRFTRTLDQLIGLRMRSALISTLLGLGQRFFGMAVLLAILGFGGYLVLIGQTTLGTLVAMQQIFMQVYDPSLNLVRIGNGFNQILACIDRIYELLNQVPQVAERADARPPRSVAGSVVFENVTFAYDTGLPVLHNVSFTAQPGEMVALVGPSGAGKTTIASLIARFYDSTEGRVLLDGIDVRDLTLSGLRDNIAVVFQDTFLFATSIRENIAFGRPSATEQEIAEAARAAQAWEFIERFPDGLDTKVGQRGVRLSEGQKQRLAIARAMLRDPRILILDEPTSALDARSEHLLELAFDRLMHGRTTFVIAHRLATIRRADRILVVEDGRVVAQGSHARLLDEGGLYRELFDLQFGVARPLVAV